MPLLKLEEKFVDSTLALNWNLKYSSLSKLQREKMEMKKSSSILVNKNTITSIAIGGFDGMHVAHQELFKI